MAGELVLFGLIVAVVAVVGIVVGMLLAPRLTRLAERDEDSSDRHD